jgi:K+-transporting ATPase A subunit
MYGMLFVIIAVFVAGLMVGRTPEYVGKKIEAKEVKMAMMALLILPMMYLGWTAIAMMVPSAVAAMGNPGPHGFTEVLYAYTSQDGNNGSAFAELSSNTLFYNLTGAVAMFVGQNSVVSIGLGSCEPTSEALSQGLGSCYTCTIASMPESIEDRCSRTKCIRVRQQN